MRERTVLIVLAVILLSATAPRTHADDPLDRRMRDSAPSSTDCGRTAPGGANRAAVLACLRSHLASQAPFRLRFDGTCIDSVCSWGLYRAEHAGAFRLLPYDQEGCSPANDTDTWCGTFGETPCRNPQIAVTRGKVLIRCEGFEL